MQIVHCSSSLVKAGVHKNAELQQAECSSCTVRAEVDETLEQARRCDDTQTSRQQQHNFFERRQQAQGCGALTGISSTVRSLRSRDGTSCR